MKLFFAEDSDKSSGGEDKAIAEILSEGDKRAERDKTSPAKSLDELHSKFSAKDRMGVQTRPEARSEARSEVKSEVKQETNGEVKKEEKREEKKEDKKELPFVRRIVEGKKAVETELAELKPKLEKFEKEEKPRLESQIVELQKKIDSGDFSSKKVQEYEDKLQKLESEFVEKEQTLVNENKKYKERIELINMQESEGFQKEYVEPVRNHFRAVMQIIGNDEKKQKLLHRAFVSNSASLSATTEEDRSAAESERDEVLSTIAESLSQFTQGRFVDTMSHYIDASQKHAVALSEGQKTAITLREKEKAEVEKSRNQIIENWGRAYKVVGEEFSDDLEIPKELEPYLKELNYDEELKENESIAKRVVTGRGSMNESIKMIHQGRIYPVMKAKIEGLEKRVKELQETIVKQKGSGTSSEDVGQSKEKQVTSREEWEKKFSANRPNLRKGPD